MKKLFLLLIAAFISTFSFAQQVKYQLSSHILDITQGKPAAGVTITLSKLDRQHKWVQIDEKRTDENGRVKDFLPMNEDKNNKGVYKLTFLTQPYFTQLNESTFYPFIEVVFEIKDAAHYHVPITLSPFGYSTYRGN